jgi:phospholipid/cholesterol/gamma-HCH transport system permease protein
LNHSYTIENSTLSIYIEGKLETRQIGRAWTELFDIIRNSQFIKAKVYCDKIEYCDGGGIALLYEILAEVKLMGFSIELVGLSENYTMLLETFKESDFKFSFKEDEFYSTLNRTEKIGFHFYELVQDFQNSLLFLGEVFFSVGKVFKNPSLIRWTDFLDITEKAGVNALPIIALIGFLMGLIMSFQSAIPMQRFGAEIFVVNLVALSLFRELGALMTAVIMAGRTSSSFAAELGTMKINEEIDALTTMALEPVQFLVIPRILAAIIVTPFLTIFFNLFGLIGCLLVMLSFDYPFVTFLNQVVKAVNYGDVLTGLFKSTVFGTLVAAVGCFQGLNTGTGASAVGVSTTNSVVHGIILIAVTDGIFSILFFFLGI